MAKILYGVNGEGFGHAARSLIVINHLKQAGHEVTVISYGKGWQFLSQTSPVELIAGASLTYENNEVKYFKTVIKSFLRSAETLKSVEAVSELADSRRIDLVITDFEPISCLVANLKKLPLISLDNQHILTKTKPDYPKHYLKAYLTDKLITRLMVFNPKFYLILSFFPGEPTSRKAQIFPPLIADDVLAARSATGDRILVYLTSGFEEISEVLTKLPHNFIIYGLSRVGQIGNCLYKKHHRQEWVNDLAKCHSIIATAGFSLISEALYLGKPYLALPAQAQFEQILNAYHLAKMGYGEHHDELTPEVIERFLTKSERYRERLGQGLQPGNELVFAKVEELIAKYCSKKKR
jgi:uncharacterized protein (TIGR00661 family)